jgi:hypothetical protein
LIVIRQAFGDEITGRGDLRGVCHNHRYATEHPFLLDPCDFPTCEQLRFDDELAITQLGTFLAQAG